MPIRNDDLVRALSILTELGIPADVQELLLRGDPMRGIKPNALLSVLIDAMTSSNDLLSRYMKHVGDVEGSTFTGHWLDSSSDFSVEEKALLRRIDALTDGG